MQNTRTNQTADLFQNSRNNKRKQKGRKSRFETIFYLLCLVLLATIAWDLSKIWGPLAVLPSAAIFGGLLFKIKWLAIWGVPLTMAYPWIMWLRGKSTSVWFWTVIIVYLIYFLLMLRHDRRAKAKPPH